MRDSPVFSKNYLILFFYTCRVGCGGNSSVHPQQLLTVYLLTILTVTVMSAAQSIQSITVLTFFYSEKSIFSQKNLEIYLSAHHNITHFYTGQVHLLPDIRQTM